MQLMAVTMSQQGMMMGPMKGHLAPNSSPFKPTINKLSSQYLIQDHLSSHYMKVTTAKAAIDNKPPKSMTTSVKKRDQMRREAMAKQMKLLDFEKEMKHGSASPHRQTPDSTLYGSQRLYSVTVTKNGYDEVRPQSASSFRSGRLSPRPRSLSSPRSFTASGSNSPRDRTRKPDILNQTYSGDYLDRHEDCFKNTNAPFTPRLKKRSGKSYLAQSKHYAPPLVLHKEVKRKTASKDKQKHPNTQSPTSSLSDINSRERTPNREKEKSKGLEEEVDSMDRLNLEDSKRTYDNVYFNRSYYDGYGFRQSPSSGEFFGTSSLGRSFTRTDSFSHETERRLQAEEEEMKYLEFINAVTNDILTRGIYSDRVLTKVMQRHLDQNRGRLNEGRMRHMLMKLQEDLGVSADITTRGFSTGSRYYDVSSVTGSDYHADSRKDSEHHSKNKLTEQVSSGEEVGTKEGAVRSHEKSKSKSKRSILKTPATSSGSDLDLRSSALSSGEEEEKTKLKKVKILNGEDSDFNSMTVSFEQKKAELNAEQTDHPEPLGKKKSLETRLTEKTLEKIEIDESENEISQRTKEGVNEKEYGDVSENGISLTTKEAVEDKECSDLDDF